MSGPALLRLTGMFGPGLSFLRDCHGLSASNGRGIVREGCLLDGRRMC